MRSLTYFVPSRDVFVARRRREWQWARRPNYELFSLRHGAPLYCRCMHLPGASPFISCESEKERERACKLRGRETGRRGLKRGMYGVENVRTSLRDSLRHLWECDTSFSSDALLRFRIVTQPSFSRPRHPRALRQRESMSMRAAMPCTRSGEDKESENAEMMIESM